MGYYYRRYLGHLSIPMTEHCAKVAISEIEDVLQHVWVAGPGAPRPGELLTEVYREVSAVLAREGAEIHCDLSIHARAANGLRDRVLQTSIESWLKVRQVPAAIHKEPLLPEGEAKVPVAAAG